MSTISLSYQVYRLYMTPPHIQQYQLIHSCSETTFCLYGILARKFNLITHPINIYVYTDLYACTLRSECQGLTLTPLLTPTVDTTYCDGVLIA